MEKRLTALWLAVIMAAAAVTAVWAAPFEPWSNVDGYWISADGNHPIRGALGRGVTISKYQNRAGSMNWKQISQDDISFVMVRLGYMDDRDPYFAQNMTNAESIGLDAGVCFFGEAMTTDQARKEAEYVLDIVKDYRVSYPIGYDVSSQFLQDQGITKRQMAALVNAFCQTVEEAGYKAAVFGDQDWLTKSIDMSLVPYDVWYNRYGVANSFQNRTIWRCTDSGQVQGIAGNVCLEFVFKDYKKDFPSDGWRRINGTYYYFSNYRMAKSTVLKLDEKYYYFDKEGKSSYEK